MSHNADTPRGFRPYGRILRKFPYGPIGAKNIYPGALVRHASNSLALAGSSSTEVIGVSAEYITSGSTGYCLVYDHPDQKFIVQGDATGSSFAAANIMDCVPIAIAGSGSASLRWSLMELDVSSADESSTQRCIRVHDIFHNLQMRKTTALNLSESRYSNSWGSWCDVIVSIARHQLSNNTQGRGT